MADTEYTRLHITPLNPALLPTILAPSILPSARNITYHTIQTFPEKSYGYLDLPMESADKLKKKLNGSILKGQKIRIETARPPKVHTPASPEPEKPKRESKKRKRDVLPAVDIGERHVKRGWTTPGKDAKDKAVVKSKFTTGPECLFKTVLPPNVASKSAKEKKKRKKDATVVHEFEKTTKYATFLRGSGGVGKKGVREFVEGKGWVDEDGEVVEEVKTTSRKSIIESKPVVEEDSDNSDGGSSSDEDADIQPSVPAMPVEGTAEEDTSSSESSADEESAVLESSLRTTAVETKTLVDDALSSRGSADEESDSDVPDPRLKEASAIESSSSESSSEDESDEEVESTPKAIVTKAASASDSSSEESSSDESETEEVQSAITSRPQSSAGPALTIKIPTPISAVHPLEALYKRPKMNANPKPTSSFSFFGADNNEDIEVETQLQVPLTPFTQKDFEFRGMRSAAPTPDTAHPNKRFVWPTEDEDDDNEASSPIRKDDKSEEGKSESDFQKWFWENRGETNRAWKKRRKEVAKEKRQRENRKRSDRAV
jgi:hypothetical protein